jgi:hypothetical protein
MGDSGAWSRMRSLRFSLPQNHKTAENASRSQWPRGLRRDFTAARLLGLRVRITSKPWMFVVSVVFSGGRGFCDGSMFRPGSPTEFM